MDQINARNWTIPLFEAEVAKHDFADLIGIFEPSGIPFSPINRPAHMYDDPHVLRPGGLHPSYLPDGTVFRAPGLPFEVDGGTPIPGELNIANVGDDTHEVLTELGLSPSQARAASGVADGSKS